MKNAEGEAQMLEEVFNTKEAMADELKGRPFLNKELKDYLDFAGKE